MKLVKFGDNQWNNRQPLELKLSDPEKCPEYRFKWEKLHSHFYKCIHVNVWF